MPEIRAFRGLRYDLGHIGSLSDVIAPPYDVIDPPLQDALYERHPSNVIRLILNRDEPGDAPDAKYARAARLLKNWRAEGVLQVEPAPALYVYDQEFSYRGATLTRRGFLARTRLERFGQGTIYPHEETHASAKEDRLKLTRACRANLSPIFGLYPDPDNQVQDALQAHIQGQPPVEAIDHLGVRHRMWPVTDLQLIGQVASWMAPKPLYIADGHHRYETACNYRDELASAGHLPADHPAHFVLMMCVGMSDPGMVVMPTHRLLEGVPRLTSEELVERLGENFTTRAMGQGVDLAPAVWQEIESAGDQGMLGLYTAADQRWTLATKTAAGEARMAERAADHSGPWQSLGVAILHRLVLEDLLGLRAMPKPTYVHQVEEVVQRLRDEPDRFALAALVMPATLEHIRQISEQGERMPAKSTYFYPKLLSGLVINPLE